MQLIRELVLGRQLYDLLEELADRYQKFLALRWAVWVGATPDGHALMLVSDGVDDSIDDLHLGEAELPADDVQEQVSPGIGHLFFIVILNWECDNPLSTGTVGRVLPLRFDMLLENEVVRIRNHLWSLVGVVVHAPEVLKSVESKHLVEDVFVMAHSLHLLFLSVWKSVYIPECPSKTIIKSSQISLTQTAGHASRRRSASPPPRLFLRFLPLYPIFLQTVHPQLQSLQRWVLLFLPSWVRMITRISSTVVHRRRHFFNPCLHPTCQYF